MTTSESPPGTERRDPLTGRPTRVSRPSVWAIVVAILAILAWSVATSLGMARQASTAANTDGMTGVYWVVGVTSLLQALVVWAIAFVAYWRSRVGLRSLAYLGILLVAALAINLSIATLGKTLASGEDRQTVAGLKAINGAYRAAVNSPDTAVIDRTPQTAGAAGELEGAIRTALAGLVEDRRAYAAAVRQIGYPELLMPKHVGRDPHQKAARAMLKKLGELGIDQDREIDARIANMRAAVRDIHMNEGSKARFLAGLDDGLPTGMEYRRQIRDLDRQIIAAHVAALDALERTRGRWKLDGDQLVFADNPTLEAWRSQVLRAERLSKEQMALARTMQTSLQTRLAELDKTLAEASALR